MAILIIDALQLKGLSRQKIPADANYSCVKANIHAPRKDYPTIE